jgi:hypothetical protein
MTDFLQVFEMQTVRFEVVPYTLFAFLSAQNRQDLMQFSERAQSEINKVFPSSILVDNEQHFFQRRMS